MQPEQPIFPSSPPAPLAADDVPPWGIVDIVIALALYGALAVAVVAIARLPFQLRLVPANLPREEIGAVLAGAVELLMLAPVWLVAIAWRRSSWRVVGFRQFKPALGCLLPIAYLCGAFSLSAAWGLVVHTMHWPTQVDVSDMFGTSPFSIAAGLLAVGVAAPIAEETLFRGFILGGLRRRLGTLGALIVSAAIFTLPHLPVTIYPAIFELGLLLGLLFVQTKSLWPGILLHAAFNTISFSAQVYCALNNCPKP